MNIRRRFLVAFVLVVVALGAAAAEYRPEAWNLQAREKFAAYCYGVFIVWGLYVNYAQGDFLHVRTMKGHGGTRC